MKRPILRLFLAVLCLGCSGSQPGPGAGEDKLRTESLFCAEWAKAACNDEVVSACNAESRSDCLATQKSACQVLVPSGYTSDDAEDCLDAVRDAYADAELTADELEIVLHLGGACGTLVDGGVSEGEACSSSFDCSAVDGFSCVIKPGESEGTCQIPVEVGGGDQCSDPENVCAPDFFCNGSDCLRRRALDDACTNDEMCAANLRCEIATGASEGTCIARIGNGDPCMTDDECVSDVCLGSTETDKICVSSVILTVRDPLCRELR